MRNPFPCIPSSLVPYLAELLEALNWHMTDSPLHNRAWAFEPIKVTSTKSPVQVGRKAQTWTLERRTKAAVCVFEKASKNRRHFHIPKPFTHVKKA